LKLRFRMEKSENTLD